MTTSAPRHLRVSPAASGALEGSGPSADVSAAGPRVPQPDLHVWCHRNLRGPFTGAGSLLRGIMPELTERHPAIPAARPTEVAAVAPELEVLPPQTLTNTAIQQERTRFYPATRALRIAHGLAELLVDWARAEHPGGVVLAFRDLDHADPTDRDFVAVLLRRCDPAVLTVVAESDPERDRDRDVRDDLLAAALAAWTVPATGALAPLPPVDGVDAAQQFIDSDGTTRDPAAIAAYEALPPHERAHRHTARAELLTRRGEQSLLHGAVPYHRERGLDRAGAGLEAFVAGVNGCFNLGCYEAVIDLALRGRALVADTKPKEYWNLTHKVGAALSYLGRGEDALGCLQEIRAGTTEPVTHMNAAYQLAMLYTRFLPRELHDEDLAMGWVNTAIAIAEREPDPVRRALVRAFMRNARALVELHRGNLAGALDLVGEAMAITDADCSPDEQLLHRSVLLYNRAQVRAATGDHVGSLRDYDAVIAQDPLYGDYYFERAAQHRALGAYEAAFADYAESVRLTPPFHEAHYNRADLLRELGRTDEALADLDYAIEIEPEHVDSLINRADLRLARGDADGARADISRGLELEPSNPHLLAARGALLAETGDPQGALADYGAALAADPTLVPAWVNRAVLWYSMGRSADAVADLDQALALDGDLTELRFNRAVALQELGEHRRALADLEVVAAQFAEPAEPAEPGVAADGIGGAGGTGEAGQVGGPGEPGDAGGPDPEVLYRRGLSRHALGDVEGAADDWRAHLAAYPGPEGSPFAKEIEALNGAQAGDLP
ncbi:tetratricopeptide repeat protein [Streptacidiphilus anmyonensis]|uniref:tetratricopeptide repeat protein n=1 Tax=Streptacidiphilus anmyonensis TaxID=405782 RepID=UPI0006934C1E|nr:tetratricopeptide repeat protein [Streptacidiphilus anmyonensis]